MIAWQQFVVDMTKALAWPAAVMVAAIFAARPLAAIRTRLTRAAERGDPLKVHAGGVGVELEREKQDTVGVWVEPAPVTISIEERGRVAELLAGLLVALSHEERRLIQTRLADLDDGGPDPDVAGIWPTVWILPSPPDPGDDESRQ